eukprot:1151985-Pelagomonas_calceolata.AAC.4
MQACICACITKLAYTDEGISPHMQPKACSASCCKGSRSSKFEGPMVVTVLFDERKQHVAVLLHCSIHRGCFQKGKTANYLPSTTKFPFKRGGLSRPASHRKALELIAPCCQFDAQSAPCLLYLL